MSEPLQNSGVQQQSLLERGSLRSDIAANREEESKIRGRAQRSSRDTCVQRTRALILSVREATPPAMRRYVWHLMVIMSTALFFVDVGTDVLVVLDLLATGNG
eukprot:4072947-Prymnesium_polylepis.1